MAIASVVDYDAWKKGYMPPSEHVLIDMLSYRGARVVWSMDLGKDAGAVWLVMKGLKPTPAQRKLILKMMELVFDENEPGFDPVIDPAPIVKTDDQQ